MTITRTTRFGLYRWSAFIDAFTRTQMDESYENIEQYGLKMISGSSLPQHGSAEYERTFFLNTSDNRLYYYTTDDANGQWIKIEPNGIRFTVAEAKGDMLVAPGPDQWARLPAGTQNQILTVLNDAGDIGWSTILSNRGDLLSSSGSDISILGVGTNSQTLRADNTTSSGLKWGLIVEANLANSAFTTPKIANNAISTSIISDNAVTSPVIADGAVVSDVLATGSVTGIKFANSSVSTTKLADLSVTTQKIADLSISASKIADRSVLTSAIADNAVETAKIANDAVTNEKIAASAVTSTRLDNGAVTQSKILDGAVTGQKIAPLAVTTPKLADGSVITVKYVDNSITTDKFKPLSVTSGKIIDSSITSPVFADGAVTTEKIQNNAVTTAKISDLALSGSKFADGSVNQNDIALNTVTSDRIRKSAALSIIGNPTGSVANVQDIVASVDHAPLKRSGSSLIFGTLVEDDVPTGVITEQKVASNAIVDSKISGSANLNLTKFSTGQLPDRVTVTTANYTANSFTVNKFSAMQTAEGVCSWVPYAPTLYCIPAYDYGPQPSTMGLVLNGWRQRNERLENPTSYVEPSSRYNILHAKYARIGKICYVSCSIEYLYQNTFWPNYPEFVSNGTPNAAVVLPVYPLVSLPFPKDGEDACITGGMRLWQSRTLDIRVTDTRTSGTRFPAGNLVTTYGEAMRCDPIIWKNTVAPYGSTVAVGNIAYQWANRALPFVFDSRFLFGQQYYETISTNIDVFESPDGRYQETDKPLAIGAQHIIRNRIKPVALAPGSRIDFNIWYNLA